MKHKKPGPKKGTKHSDVERSAFGLRLFTARKARGMTQQELADLLGITKRMVAHYESDTEGPTVDRVAQIAAAVNVTASYLLGESTLKVIKEDVKPALQKHFKLIQELPGKDQKKILEYVDLLAKKQEDRAAKTG